MLNVPIDRIVPLTDARDNFSRIVADIENQKDGLYVLTKGGKPAIALINISYLSELMNGTAVLPQPHSKPVEIEKEKEVVVEPIKPKVEEKLPSPPTTIETPKAPELRTAPKPAETNPINPTWTGQQSVPPTKPVNPWPITPSTSAQAPVAAPIQSMATPTPPISAPSIPVPPAPPPPPPPPTTTPAMSVPAPAIEAPKPVIPPPPPNPVTSTIPVPVKVSTDLPPPPNNPTTIPFDEPPKTIPEPGEEMPPPATTMTSSTSTPTPATPTATPLASTPPPAVSSSVQDIDI